MSNVYGYIRVSTTKQGQQGVSLQEQRSAIERYAERNGLAIVAWFEEQETAAKRGRPVFGKMLRQLRTHQAQGVVIHKIDRGARNLKDWADLGELIDRGITVHFANESLDLNTRGGRLSADIQAVVAADFIRNLRDETRKGFYGRLKQGIYPLPAPLGYVDNGKGKPKTPDPGKAPLVRKAFELYGTGRFNLRTLAKEMYEYGLRNKRARKVSINGIARILHNPFYIGLIHLTQTGETFVGAHEPLIRKELFDRVQDILQGKFSACTQRYDFTFRRLLTCTQCGYSLIGELHKGFRYYRCHRKHDPATSVREERVNETILAQLSPLQFDGDELPYMLNRVKQMKERSGLEQESTIKALELNRQQLEDRINRLTDAYIDRLIDKGTFENRKTALLMDQKSIDEKLQDIRTGRYSVPEQIKEILEQASSAYSSYISGLPEEKRNLLKRTTSNRAVKGKNVMIALESPFREIANRAKSLSGDLYRDRPRTDHAHLDKLIDELVAHVNRTNADCKKGEVVESGNISSREAA